LLFGILNYLLLLTQVEFSWLVVCELLLVVFDLVAESGAGDDVFIIRLRDVWHKQWNLDVHSESCIRSLCDQLEKLEHAKQSQQSPTQVVTFEIKEN